MGPSEINHSLLQRRFVFAIPLEVFVKKLLQIGTCPRTAQMPSARIRKQFFNMVYKILHQISLWSIDCGSSMSSHFNNSAGAARSARTPGDQAQAQTLSTLDV